MKNRLKLTKILLLLLVCVVVGTTSQYRSGVKEALAAEITGTRYCTTTSPCNFNQSLTIRSGAKVVLYNNAVLRVTGDLTIESGAYIYAAATNFAYLGSGYTPSIDEADTVKIIVSGNVYNSGRISADGAYTWARYYGTSTTFKSSTYAGSTSQGGYGGDGGNPGVVAWSEAWTGETHTRIGGAGGGGNGGSGYGGDGGWTSISFIGTAYYKTPGGGGGGGFMSPGGDLGDVNEDLETDLDGKNGKNLITELLASGGGTQLINIGLNYHLGLGNSAENILTQGGGRGGLSGCVTGVNTRRDSAAGGIVIIEAGGTISSISGSAQGRISAIGNNGVAGWAGRKVGCPNSGGGSGGTVYLKADSINNNYIDVHGGNGVGWVGSGRWFAQPSGAGGGGIIYLDSNQLGSYSTYSWPYGLIFTGNFDMGIGAVSVEKRTYRDSARTQETATFNAGETVYVRVVITSPSGSASGLKFSDDLPKNSTAVGWDNGTGSGGIDAANGKITQSNVTLPSGGSKTYDYHYTLP